MNKSFLDRYICWLRSKKVLKYLPRTNLVICDIGCGSPPKFLSGLENRLSQAWGIDKKIDTGNWGNNIRTVRHDLDLLSVLPFEENKFDFVTALAVLEHLVFPKEILAEVYRILKPGGLFILTTPAPSAKRVLEFLALTLHLISQEEIKDHKHYFAKEELLNYLKEIGFCDIKHRYFELGLNQIVVARKK